MATSQSAKFYIDRERIQEHVQISGSRDARLEILNLTHYKGERHRKSATKHLGAMEQQLWEDYKELEVAYSRRKKHLAAEKKLNPDSGSVIKSIVDRVVMMSVERETLLSVRRAASKWKKMKSRGRTAAKAQKSTASCALSKAERKTFLDALPEDLREEALEQEKREKRDEKERRYKEKQSAGPVLVVTTKELSSDAIKMHITLSHITHALARGTEERSRNPDHTRSLPSQAAISTKLNDTIARLAKQARINDCNHMSPFNNPTPPEQTRMARNIVSLKKGIANLARDMGTLGYEVHETQFLSSVPSRLRGELEAEVPLQYLGRADMKGERSWSVGKESGLRNEVLNMRKIERRSNAKFKMKGMLRFLGEQEARKEMMDVIMADTGEVGIPLAPRA